MFLRKSPLPPACLEANRHNAKKSTGPHTTRSKQVARTTAFMVRGFSKDDRSEKNR
jgi:hypothetical protein